MGPPFWLPPQPGCLGQPCQGPEYIAASRGAKCKKKHTKKLKPTSSNQNSLLEHLTEDTIRKLKLIYGFQTALQRIIQATQYGN